MTATQTYRPRGRIIRAQDMVAWRDGDAYVAAAQAEAQRILAEARAQGDRLIAEGRAEGERAGEAAITRRVAEATSYLDALLHHSEAWLADLVVETVARILGEMDSHDAMLAAAVTALRSFRHAHRLVLRVHPSVVASVEAGLDRELDPGLRALVVIQPDPTLGRGRCVVVSEHGTVEAGIAEQLSALRDGLRTQAEHGASNHG